MTAGFSKTCGSAILIALASALPVRANPIPLFPIKTLEVTFDGGLAERFALDNLTFDTLGFSETLEFDEVLFQPADGLTVTTALGNTVTFGFTVGGASSTDASYNGSFGPDPFSYVLDPVLEGTTSGVLTVVFGQAISFVSFGLAVNTFDTGIAATVRLLLEDGTDLSTIQKFDNLVEVEPIQAFSEGTFSIPSVPEPGLGSLIGAGLVAAVLRAGRRRRSRF